jgi:large subunit ribosomal protein L9
MKVILIERVSTLGDIGEMVKVSPGYARNFLFPRKLAIFADAAHQRQLENQKRRLTKKIEAQRNVALELKKKIEQVQIDLVKKVGANGKLFGSVTTQELAHELENRGVKIDRRQIITESAIKSTGNYSVRVKLFTDVDAHFKVKVMMDPKQIEEMKARQASGEKKVKGKKAKAEEASAAAPEAAEGEAAPTPEAVGEVKKENKKAKVSAKADKVEKTEKAPKVERTEKPEKLVKKEKKSKKSEPDA